MKTMGFYQVFDNIGNIAITNLIPAQNRLTAALGFRNAYMMEKDPVKNPYIKTYKALELREISIADVLDDGSLFMYQSPSDEKDIWFLKGDNIINFINSEMQAKGIDDFLVDDEKEVE